MFSAETKIKIKLDLIVTEKQIIDFRIVFV